ncbi:MAG: dihydrolipoamide acetyltransferase family protein [Candidatus Micrarchaeia archaeon]
MKEIKFVDVGEGITEGHLQKWLVNDGDTVKEDQSLAQVETDKAVVNVPAPTAGKIRIMIKEGSDLHLGDLLAYIGTDQELNAISAQAKPSSVAAVQQAQQAKPAQIASSKPSAPIPPSTPPSSEAEIIATPSVRKLAEQLGVSLAHVHGSGPHGRILESDVHAAASGVSKAATSSIARTSTHEAPPSPSKPAEEKHAGEIERVPLSQTRKAIARNMELSWTIPRATHMDIINATSLFNIVEKEKKNAEASFGVKVTFLPFIIKAVVEALKENPHFNASYDKDNLEILVKKYYNIGLAAEAPDGLKVVVVRNADKKSIIELAKEIEELSKKVRDQTISLDEMKDSSFTITNIGSLGGGFLSVPVINYPDVAILGIHMIRDFPVVSDGMVKVGKILPFSLVFDHRVVDGAEAVKFGNALIKYLEDPDFLEMLD